MKKVSKPRGVSRFTFLASKVTKAELSLVKKFFSSKTPSSEIANIREKVLRACSKILYQKGV